MREEKTFEITLSWLYAAFVVPCEVQRITTSNIYKKKKSMTRYTSSNSGFQARLLANDRPD